MYRTFPPPARTHNVYRRRGGGRGSGGRGGGHVISAMQQLNQFVYHRVVVLAKGRIANHAHS